MFNLNKSYQSLHIAIEKVYHCVRFDGISEIILLKIDNSMFSKYVDTSFSEYGMFLE